jgi:hypothetical protein
MRLQPAPERLAGRMQSSMTTTSAAQESDADREWLGRAFGWCMAVGSAWLVIMFLVFLASTVAADIYERVLAWVTGVGAGAVAAWFGESALTPAKGGAKSGVGMSFNTIATIAAVLFAAMLIVMTSALLDMVLLRDTLINSAHFRGQVVESDYPPWPAGWWLPKTDGDTPLCALGTVDYGDGQVGIVLYVKAAYHKAIVRNVGVRSYALANPDFPHQSTADQFFSESQFESYRALGFEVMRDILTRGTALLVNPERPTIGDILSALHDRAVSDGRP